MTRTKLYFILPILLGAALLLALFSWLSNVSVLAAPRQVGTGVDPQIRNITVTAGLLISDTRPGDGVDKTVYVNNNTSGVMTVTWEISGTAPLTMTAGTAFDRETAVYTVTDSPWIQEITYTLSAGAQENVLVPYTATNDLEEQTTVEITYISDITGATTTIEGPIGPVTGTTALLEGTALDNDGGAGVQQVQVKTGSIWETATGTDPWSFVWTLPSADYLPYTIAAQATDYVGNTGDQATRVIYVDTVAPTTVTPVPDHSPWISNTVTYTWPPATDNAGIDVYQLQVTNTQGYSATFTTAEPAWSFNEAYTENVEYRARVRAIDTNGNVGPWSSLSIAVKPDLTPPPVRLPWIEESSDYLYASDLTLFYTNTMTAAPFWVQGLVDDDGLSELDHAVFSKAFNQTPPIDTTPAVFDGRYDVPNGSTASGTITATIYDQVGNTTVQTYTYELDGTPPTSLASAPASFTDPETPIPVTWTALDSQSGVQSTTLWYKKETTGTWTLYQTQGGTSGTFNFVPPAGDGLYLFAAVAQDQLNNPEAGPAATETQTLYDTQVPQSRVTWAPSYTNSTPITVTWVVTPSIAPFVQVDLWYRFDGGTWQPAALTSTELSGAFSFVPPHGDGVYDLATVAQDTLKSEATPAGAGDATVVYDSAIGAPISLAPIVTGWSRTAFVTVTWENPIDLAGINKAYYKLDAAPTSPNDGTGIAGDQIEQLTHIALPTEAIHTLWVWLADRAGNVDHTQSQTTELWYDATVAPPLTPTVSPSGWTRTNVFTLSWTNPADLSGITGAFYRLDAVPLSPTDGTWRGGSDLEGMSGLSVPGDGTHTLALWLRDAAGNADHNTRRTVTLRYDATVPANLAIQVPQQSANLQFAVSWSASDPASGIASYRVEYRMLPNGNWQTWLPSTTQQSALFTAPQDETDYAFRLTAYDQAGNMAQTQTTTHVGHFYVFLPTTINRYASWYAVDIYEPNNEPGEAYGPLISSQIYQAYIWDQTDVSDYYFYTSLVRANLQVDLTQIPSPADYDLYVYDYYAGQYRLIAYSNRTGTVSEQVTWIAEAGVKYYIRVYAYQGSSSQQPYRLLLTGE